MKRMIILAAILAGGAGAALAQSATNGVGDARERDLPSTEGLSHTGGAIVPRFDLEAPLYTARTVRVRRSPRVTRPD